MQRKGNLWSVRYRLGRRRWFSGLRVGGPGVPGTALCPSGGCLLCPSSQFETITGAVPSLLCASFWPTCPGCGDHDGGDATGCTLCSSDLGASPSPTGTCHSLIPHLWASALESCGPEGAGRCLWTPECARGAVRALRALLFPPGMPGGNLSPYPACSLCWALPWN